MKPIEIIKVYRKKRNYTQEDIAKELNMDRTTYNNIEKGKNNLKADDFIKLINYLKIPIMELSEEELIVISKEDLEILNKSVNALSELTKNINEKSKIENNPNIYDNHGIINFNK